MSTTSLEFHMSTFDNSLRSEEDYCKMSQEVLDSYFKRDSSEKISDLLTQIEDVLADERYPLWKRTLALRFLRDATNMKSKKFANCLARQKSILQQIYLIASTKKSICKTPKGRTRSNNGSDAVEARYTQLAIECVCKWKSKFGKAETKTAERFRRLYKKLDKEIELPKGDSLTDSDIEEPRRKEKEGNQNTSLPDLRTVPSMIENDKSEEETKAEGRGSIREELKNLEDYFNQYLKHKTEKTNLLLKSTGNRKTFMRKISRVLTELGADILRANTKATMIMGRYRLPLEERKLLLEIEKEFNLHRQTEVALQKEPETSTSAELLRKLDAFFGVQFSDPDKISSQTLTILVPKVIDTFEVGDTPLGMIRMRGSHHDKLLRTSANTGSATTPDFNAFSHEMTDSPVGTQISPQGTNATDGSPRDSHKKSPFSQQKEKAEAQSQHYNPEVSEQAMQRLLKTGSNIFQDLKNIQEGIVSSLKQRNKPWKNFDSPAKINSPQELPVISERKAPTSSFKAKNKSDIDSFRNTCEHEARESLGNYSHSTTDAKTQSDYRSKFTNTEWLSGGDKNSSQENSLQITLKNDQSLKSFDFKELDNSDQSFTEVGAKGSHKGSEEVKQNQEFARNSTGGNVKCPDMEERGTFHPIREKLSLKYGGGNVFQKIDETLNESNNQTIKEEYSPEFGNRVLQSQEPNSEKRKSLVCTEYYSHGEVVSNGGTGRKSAKPTSLHVIHKRTGSYGENSTPVKKNEAKLAKFRNTVAFNSDQISTDEQSAYGSTPSSSQFKGSPLSWGTGSPASIDSAGSIRKQNSPGSLSRQGSYLNKTPKYSQFREKYTGSPAIYPTSSEQSNDTKVYKLSSFSSNGEENSTGPNLFEKSYISAPKGKGNVFENEYVSIKSSYSLIEDSSQPHRCLKVVLLVRNQSNTTLNDFNVSFVVDSNLKFVKLPDKTDPSIPAGKKTVIEFVLGVVKPSFTRLKMKCSASINLKGKPEDLSFKFAVPVTYNMFMSFQSQISSREFFASWKDTSNVILKGEAMVITNPQIKSPEDFSSVLGHLIIYPGLIDESGKPKAYSLMGKFELDRRNVEYLLRINWIPESRTAAFQVACKEENIIEGRFILQTLQSLFCHVKTIKAKH